jgi:ATP-dependent DNA helicase RecQ
MLTSLKKYFGYDEFKPLQKEVIDHVMSGREGLVLMPTGGGKSLCYQLPALEMAGITIVVSPLIALMKDQVDALKANGIPAAYINSSLDYAEIVQIERAAQSGELKLLYLAPERLAIPKVQEFLQTLKVSLFAVDEAHCISEWGHDFRPDYRNLRAVRELFPCAPVLALTATANKRVKEDILEQLKLKDARVFQSSFDRSNLSYRVMPKKQVLQKASFSFKAGS